MSATFYVNLSIKIDWSEMDVLGHVNNVSYFKYIQTARINYWVRCGLSPLFDKSENVPILLSTGCQFMKPLYYPGNIVVETRLEYIKNTSYGLHHRILNEANEIAAEAHDVIVNYNFVLNSKVPVSDEFKKVIGKVEGDKSFQ